MQRDFHKEREELLRQINDTKQKIMAAEKASNREMAVILEEYQRTMMIELQRKLYEPENLKSGMERLYEVEGEATNDRNAAWGPFDLQNHPLLADMLCNA